MNISLSELPACAAGHDGAVLEKRFFLTAGEADVANRMPPRLMAMRAIEVATDHSNLLGVGYEDLAVHNMRWVLLRMSAEISRFPAVNEAYSAKTWIGGVNNYFSYRRIEFYDRTGASIIKIQTTWAAIDLDTRALASLGKLDPARFPTAEMPLDVARMPRPALNGAEKDFMHGFGVVDIDFNRHVNAVSYINVAVNCLEMSLYAGRQIRRLDVDYEHECYFGEPIRVVHGADANVSDSFTTEFYHADSRRGAVVRLAF